MKWYDRITASPDDFSPLIDSLIWFENEYNQAVGEVKISGSFEKASAELPGIMQYRYSQLQEIEAILEYLNLRKERVHCSAFKKYLETYNRTLTSRDAERYANGDDKVYELAMLINQVALVRNSFLSITKGLECKHFTLGNLAKMKTAGMEDYFIRPYGT
jgi:hypothetical protein